MKQSPLVGWRSIAAVAVGGTIIAGAVAHASSWAGAATVELFVALTALAVFSIARSNSDVGSVIGHHADERQRLLALRAYALSMKVMYVAAFVCVVIAIALRQDYWQADVVGSAGGLSFVVGLRALGLDVEADSELGATRQRDGERHGV